MLAALTKCVRGRIFRNATDSEGRCTPKTPGGHGTALSKSDLEGVANLLYNGRKDRARSFVQDARKLRDLADFVTDQDLAAILAWLAPLLDELPRETPSGKYICVSRLLFPGSRRRADKHMQCWIEHVLLLRQLAVTSYAGDMLAALVWVETPHPARGGGWLHTMVPRPQAQGVPHAVSGPKFSRPTMVTATATTATVRGKPSRPRRTLSSIAKWAGL
jgi:hypothetical protein